MTTVVTGMRQKMQAVFIDTAILVWIRMSVVICLHVEMRITGAEVFRLVQLGHC